MKKLPLLAIFCTLSGTAFADGLQVVNAASLSAVSIAPGSIAAIKGNNLTTGVTVAPDPQNPPTSLGGVSVTIGGTAAALFYVSPTQINLYVDAATPTGAAEPVVVTSASGKQTGSVTVDSNAAPGLFALSGAGTRDGAIVSAVNFLLGDFSTRIAGAPAYLALFATGLNTAAAPTVTIGGVQVQVTFAGPVACCKGLEQINVMLPDSLGGAGRVPVVLTSNGQTSNTVQVVLLPSAGAGPFQQSKEQGKRSRELASLAYIPKTSLMLSADENDDVVRVIDLSSKKVTEVITLPQGSGPSAIAVNTAGTLAVVAEKDAGKAAILDLSKLATITAAQQISTGLGPVAVAIGGTEAVVANADDNTVTVIDLSTGKALGTIPVGHAPQSIAIDGSLAYVVNENDGSISLVDLTGLKVKSTLTLGTSLRPESIALLAPGAGIAYVTVPGAGPNGQVLTVDLSKGTFTSLDANPEHSGGSSAVLVFKTNVYFANQAGGSVSVLAVDSKTGAATGPITQIKVDLGARALAIDTTDNLLAVSNEGTGTVVLVDLTTNKVTARINAVQTNLQADDNDDDHSDRGAAANLPAITSVSPASGKAGAAAFTLTIAGTNLSGATGVVFVDPAVLPEHGRGDGGNAGNEHSPFSQTDSAFTVTNVQPSADGTHVTATVAISAAAKTGARVVRVLTPNGESPLAISSADTFTVQ